MFFLPSPVGEGGPRERWMRRTPVSCLNCLLWRQGGRVKTPPYKAKAAKAPIIYRGGWRGFGGGYEGFPVANIVSNGGSREGGRGTLKCAKRIDRREATPVYILYYLFFLLYSLNRTSNARPYSQPFKRRIFTLCSGGNGIYVNLILLSKMSAFGALGGRRPNAFWRFIAK